jgi:NADH:ubiquinone oxidoreductase subunit 2 (subunit N)
MDFRDLIASLHAETIFPEGAIILSLLVTLLADLIFSKNTWVQSIPFVGLGLSLILLVFQWQMNATIDPNGFLSN